MIYHVLKLSLRLKVFPGLNVYKSWLVISIPRLRSLIFLICYKHKIQSSKLWKNNKMPKIKTNLYKIWWQEKQLFKLNKQIFSSNQKKLVKGNLQQKLDKDSKNMVFYKCVYLIFISWKKFWYVNKFWWKTKEWDLKIWIKKWVLSLKKTTMMS